MGWLTTLWKIISSLPGILKTLQDLWSKFKEWKDRSEDEQREKEVIDAAEKAERESDARDLEKAFNPNSSVPVDDSGEMRQ